ncbi:hypothetical protein [Fulvivirga ligni]|uniref:hypothetical protein n=1 Tax=Fulvivirga ligni TaxID=2904246 RepID=UPI001F1BD531|nr:hypothetical protein [Fulvivirga ligni]UII23371.1 hypothetical protein LVD16_09045 [Fulvivirga ligni]
MQKTKKLLRLLGLAIIIILASAGLGINGAIVPVFRRPEKENIKIELVEKRDDESDFEDEKN